MSSDPRKKPEICSRSRSVTFSAEFSFMARWNAAISSGKMSFAVWETTR